MDLVTTTNASSEEPPLANQPATTKWQEVREDILLGVSVLGLFGLICLASYGCYAWLASHFGPI